MALQVALTSPPANRENHFHTHQIAVCVPRRNEAVAIAQVIADLKQYLPEAVVYVYDNASCDRTQEIAREAGAIVRTDPLKGKGMWFAACLPGRGVLKGSPFELDKA